MQLVSESEPVLGVRVWEARQDGRLCSVYWPAKWSPGINTAACEPEGSLRVDDHMVPESGCVCGLHGYSDINTRDLAFYDRPHVVVGTIAAWGRIEPALNGFRAEKAKLLAIGEATGSCLERRASVRYGVPLVPMAELAGFSRQHANPATLAQQMHGAVILVVDCGPAVTSCLDDLKTGLHQLVRRAHNRRIDLVVCGQGSFVAPLCGAEHERERQLGVAIDQLVPDCEGPALARGMERARGRVLWSHRRWSIDVVLVALRPPDVETTEELFRARRDGVRVIALSPTPKGKWDCRLGEHVPIRPTEPGSVAEALRDVAGKLETRDDQRPTDWTRRRVMRPNHPILRIILGG